MVIRRLVSTLLLSAALITLVSCSDSQKEKTKQTAHTFIKKIKQRLPFIHKKSETKTIPAVTYTAKKLQSPFREQSAPKNSNSKAILTNEDISKLKLTGIVTKNDKKWAIVTDSQNTLHALATGFIVGKQHAVVEKITSDSIELKTKTSTDSPYSSIVRLTIQE